MDFNVLVNFTYMVGGVAILFNLYEIKSTKEQAKRELEKYKRIKLGMSYQEVIHLMREEGLIESEQFISGNTNHKKETYIWYFGWYLPKKVKTQRKYYSYNTDIFNNPKSSIETRDEQLRKYIRVVFEKDKVVYKEQIGLGTK